MEFRSESVSDFNMIPNSELSIGTESFKKQNGNQEGGWFWSKPSLPADPLAKSAVMAAKDNRFDVVEYLVNSGKIVNFGEQDDNGNTLLHYVVKNPAYNDSLLKQILSAKYIKDIINIKNKDGNTAAIESVLANNNVATKKLHDAGADLTIKNNKGLEIAAITVDSADISQANPPHLGVVSSKPQTIEAMVNDYVVESTKLSPEKATQNPDTEKFLNSLMSKYSGNTMAQAGGHCDDCDCCDNPGVPQNAQYGQMNTANPQNALYGQMNMPAPQQSSLSGQVNMASPNVASMQLAESNQLVNATAASQQQKMADVIPLQVDQVYNQQFLSADQSITIVPVPESGWINNVAGTAATSNLQLGGNSNWCDCDCDCHQPTQQAQAPAQEQQQQVGPVPTQASVPQVPVSQAPIQAVAVSTNPQIPGLPFDFSGGANPEMTEDFLSSLLTKLQPTNNLTGGAKKRKSGSKKIVGSRRLAIIDDDLDDGRENQLSRMIKNQSDEIHKKVLETILSLLPKLDKKYAKLSDEEKENVARNYKSVLWQIVKNSGSSGSNLDQSNKLLEITTLKELKKIDPSQGEKLREESRKKKEERKKQFEANRKSGPNKSLNSAESTAEMKEDSYAISATSSARAPTERYSQTSFSFNEQ